MRSTFNRRECSSIHLHDSSQIAHLGVVLRVESIRFRRIVLVNFLLQALVRVGMTEEQVEQSIQNGSSRVESCDDSKTTVGHSLAHWWSRLLREILGSLQDAQKSILIQFEEAEK